MQTLEQDLKDFCHKFNLSAPTIGHRLSHDMQVIRTRFIKEELLEYEEAVEKGDMVAAFDGLIDVTYVVIGTAVLHGFPFTTGWGRVHAANMRKVRATDNQKPWRGSFGVIKPEHWIAPKLDDLLHRCDAVVRFPAGVSQ